MPSDEQLRNEEWLLVAKQSSRLGLWYWDEVKQDLFYDKKTRQMLGVPTKGDVTPQTWVDALHPDEKKSRHFEAWRHSLEHGLHYDVEYRVQRSDGSVRWLKSRANSYCDEDGKPLRMAGVVFDITKRKDAKQERRELSRRLINAQERERARLARELHDDFSQRIAILTVEVDSLLQMTKDSIETNKRLSELNLEIKEIGTDLHSLSHRLHSSKLEILGLAASVKSFCAEFAERHGIRIDFSQKDVPVSIPPENALCLYRIVQEGLRNVSKHSHGSNAQVRLARSGDEISLMLLDNGIGFEPSSICASEGIGVLSMKERAGMLGGSFEIKSRPMHGTLITATVPFKKHPHNTA